MRRSMLPESSASKNVSSCPLVIIPKKEKKDYYAGKHAMPILDQTYPSIIRVEVPKKQQVK